MYKSVMVVDDLDINCQITRQVILHTHFADQVSCFNSGPAALQHLDTVHQFPDIIFLDLHMPEMDGFQFAEAYQRAYQREGKQCRIVVLSASDSTSDFARLKNYPAINGFMSKPLTARHLDQLMQQPPYTA